MKDNCDFERSGVLNRSKERLGSEKAGVSNKNIQRWIVSPEGRKAIEASLKQASEQSSQFREAQKVSPESLYKPITH